MPWHKGTKPVYSSQEVTQLIFMDSESEGKEIPCRRIFGQYKIGSESDFEPDEDYIESSGDEERLTEFVQQEVSRLPGHGIRSMPQCSDCTGNPCLCAGECC